MKFTIFLVFFLIPALAISQMLNQKTKDEKKNNEMLIGYCSREGFSEVKCNFDSVYKAEYPLYKPDAATMKLLHKKMKGVKVTVVMATWCSDSKDWIPRFYKIMDALNFNYRNLTLICVDRSKKAPETSAGNLNIEKVPTLIFYRKKTELGRIIEVPVDLLEKDILRIVTE